MGLTELLVVTFLAALVTDLAKGIQLTTGIQIWQVGAGLFGGVFFFMAATRWIRGSHEFDFAGLRKKGGSSAVLIVAALTLHSLPEEIAIGVAFGAAPEAGGTVFGVSVALALAVHNIPEGARR